MGESDSTWGRRLRACLKILFPPLPDTLLLLLLLPVGPGRIPPAPGLPAAYPWLELRVLVCPNGVKGVRVCPVSKALVNREKSRQRSGCGSTWRLVFESDELPLVADLSGCPSACAGKYSGGRGGRIGSSSHEIGM